MVSTDGGILENLPSLSNPICRPLIAIFHMSRPVKQQVHDIPLFAGNLLNKRRGHFITGPQTPVGPRLGPRGGYGYSVLSRTSICLRASCGSLS